MRKNNFLVIVLFQFILSFNLAYSQENTKSKESDFEYFKSKSKVLMKCENRDIKLEKLSWVGYKMVMLYSIDKDSSNIHVSVNDFTRRSTWKSDTIELKTWSNSLFFNHNLAVYDVEYKKGSSFMQIFSGKDTTYTISIKNKYDIKSQFSRINSYHLGKVMGVTYGDNNEINAYFNTNSLSLINKRVSDINYLYKITSNSYGAYWSIPTYILKHNKISFETCSFAKHYIGKVGVYYAMFSSKKNDVPYLSINDTKSDEWSYPKKFSPTIAGHSHKLFINKDMVYVVFYRTDKNSGIDEMIIWYGTLRNFEKGCIEGKTVQATMNYRFKNLSASEIEKINASMNLEVVPFKNNKVFAVISAKWDIDAPSYILGVEIHEKRLRLD